MRLPRSFADAAARQTTMRTSAEHAAMRSPPAPPRRRKDRRGAVERRVAAAVERRYRGSLVNNAVFANRKLAGHNGRGHLSLLGNSICRDSAPFWALPQRKKLQGRSIT